MFLINLPACALAYVFAVRVLPAGHHHDDRPKLDVIGMILCSVAVGLFVYPVIQGREHQWAWWTYAMMLASTAVLAVFGLHARARRRKALDAFIETGPFRKRSFTGGTVTVFLFFGACSGAFIVSPLLLQLYIGWSPLHVGLTGSSWSLGTILAMCAGPALARRIPPRRVLEAGILTQAVGMGLAAHARETTHPGPLLDTGLTDRRSSDSVASVVRPIHSLAGWARV